MNRAERELAKHELANAYDVLRAKALFLALPQWRDFEAGNEDLIWQANQQSPVCSMNLSNGILTRGREANMTMDFEEFDSHSLFNFNIRTGKILFVRRHVGSFTVKDQIFETAKDALWFKDKPDKTDYEIVRDELLRARDYFARTHE